MINYPTHEVWGGYDDDEPRHLEDCFSMGEAKQAAAEWATGGRYAFVRSKDGEVSNSLTEVAMMARVKVYEQPTPEIKFVDGVLMQNWMIQWRDDETRGAANPQTYELRPVVSETSGDRKGEA